MPASLTRLRNGGHNELMSFFRSFQSSRTESAPALDNNAFRRIKIILRTV